MGKITNQKQARKEIRGLAETILNSRDNHQITALNNQQYEQVLHIVYEGLVMGLVLGAQDGEWAGKITDLMRSSTLSEEFKDKYQTFINLHPVIREAEKGEAWIDHLLEDL
jgi:hypothetical protein